MAQLVEDRVDELVVQALAKIVEEWGLVPAICDAVQKEYSSMGCEETLEEVERGMGRARDMLLRV